MPFQSLTTFFLVAIASILQLGTIAYALNIPVPNNGALALDKRGDPGTLVDTTTDTPANPSFDAITKRWLTMECPGGYPYYSKKRVEEGIKYLNGVGGKPKNQAFSGSGPYANCGRFGCSYGAAIYWCNINNYVLEPNSYKQIADTARQVVDVCNTGSEVVGSATMEGNWRVIVAKASC